MSRWRPRTGRPSCLLAAALALVTLAPVGALADGDPASDVLPGQDVFLPYSAISQRVEGGLYAMTAASRRAGYPVKVAVIAGRSDLGVVPALFGKPAAYAKFLSSELAGVIPGPALVVMPDGFGLAAAGRAMSVAGLAGRAPLAAAAVAVAVAMRGRRA